MLKKSILPIALLAIVAISIWYFMPNRKIVSQNEDIIVQVVEEDLEVTVEAVGELAAKYSVKIRGPEGMRTNRIYETSITNIVPEGTIVTEGSYVATLDKTELDTRMKDIQTEIEKTETQLEQAKIDTAIEMRSMRDQLVNLHFSLEEKELQLELNKYEPQATIRQVELDVAKIERDAVQLKNKIRLSKDKSLAKVMEIEATRKQNVTRLNRLAELGKRFTITAPKDGMIIYSRGFGGKVGPGSRISSWDPVIAELPDLSAFISKTYVNEVDISKISLGQEVSVKVDAFPDQSFPAMVKQVANIGEQLKNFDAKVFEVIVELTEADSILRPAMTTQNSIITDSYQKQLVIPIEAIQIDSFSYVFKKEAGKTIKQEVITSASNDSKMIVNLGLSRGDEIYVNVPSNAESFKIKRITPEEKENTLKAIKEDQKKRKEQRIALSKKVKREDLRTQDAGSSSIMIFR